MENPDKIFINFFNETIDIRNINHLSKKEEWCDLRNKVIYYIIINTNELSFSKLKCLKFPFETEKERTVWINNLNEKLSENKIEIK